MCMCIRGVSFCWDRRSLGPLLFGSSVSGSNLCQMDCHKCPQLWGGEGWRLTMAAWVLSQETANIQHDEQGRLNLEND